MGLKLSDLDPSEVVFAGQHSGDLKLSDLHPNEVSFIPGFATGDDPENPSGKDLYGDYRSRMASSFGNDPGIAGLLAKSGYVDAKRNSKGEFVVKHASDGKWYKDQDNFLDHPINYAEAHLGSALPLIGMAAGGGSAGIPGAAAGAMGGEGLRQATGRALGTYEADPLESLKDTALEGAGGAAGEAIGKPISEGLAYYAKPLIPAAKDAIKKGVSTVSEFMSGVPKEAVERLIERPGQVMNAESDGNALNVARRARDEFLNRDSQEDQAIQAARQKFRAQFGDQPVDTSPIIKNQNDFVSKNAPTNQGTGPLSENEIQNINGIEKRDLTTTQKKPGMYEDTENYLPQKSAGDLQKLADSLSTQIKNFDQSKAPGSGDTRYQSYLRGLYGKVKARLHDLNPEGLGAADSRFSNYADDAGRLGRLENEDTMEGFINNFYGKNKTLMRESAQNVIPESAEDIADIGASRAFSKQGPAGSDMGRRSLGGIAAGSGVAATMHGSPLGFALGVATAASTSPALHKAVIGNASKLMEAPWFKAIQANPQLVESIANPELKKMIQGLLKGSQQAGEALPNAAEIKKGREERSIANDPVIHPDERIEQYMQGN